MVPLSLKYAARSLWAAPWFVLSSVGVLVVSFNMAAVVFAVVDGELFRALPYPEAQELFVVRGAFQEYPAAALPPVSARDAHEWATAEPSVLFALMDDSILSVGLGAPSAPRIVIQAVDEQFLQVLGIEPLEGGFTSADFSSSEQSDSEPAVITHAFWATRLGGRGDAIGMTLPLASGSSTSLRIVGVLPSTFVFPAVSGRTPPDALVPLVVSRDAAESFRRRSYDLIARIPATVSITELRSKLQARSILVSSEFPLPLSRPGLSPMARRTLGPFDSVDVRPLQAYLIRHEGPALKATLASVLLLLALTISNVVGLGMSRMHERKEMFLTQQALGADAWTLARFAVIEVCLIGVLATVLTLAISPAMLSAARALLPESMVLLGTPSVTRRVVAVVLVTGLAFVIVGAASILAAFRRLLHTHHLGSTAHSVAVRVPLRTARILISLQVAIGLVSSIGGCLAADSVRRAWATDVGFDPNDVMLADVNFRSGEAGSHLTTLLYTITRIPGVIATGAAEGGFLQRGGGFDGSPFRLPSSASSLSGVTKIVFVSGGLFEALRLRLVDGRFPTVAEITRGDPVVVVSKTVALQYWPGGRAIDQTLEDELGVFRIVGIVADARFYSLDRPSEGEIYAPMSSHHREPISAAVFVRTAPRRDVAASLRAAVSSELPLGQIGRLTPLTEALSETIRPRRLFMWLFGTLAVSALLCLAIGTFGLLATLTAWRTREVGIRMVLGASPAGIVSALLYEQIPPIAAGTLVGVAVAGWNAQLLAAYLYELKPYDLHVWIAALGIVSTTASIGVLLPAARVSRVQPSRALRD